MTLYVFSGLPGVGKTSLSQRLAKMRKAAHLRIDTLEQALRDLPHRAIRSGDARIDRLRARYHAFMAAHPGYKPLYYGGQDRWHPLPAVFASSVRLARTLSRRQQQARADTARRPRPQRE